MPLFAFPMTNGTIANTSLDALVFVSFVTGRRDCFCLGVIR
jgi:hypothetical protein